MTRRERLEAKVEKRLEWAEGRTSKAEGLRKVDEHVRHDWAFITQPGRLPARERMNRRDAKAAEHHQMAKHHETKAAGLAHQLERTIFSDDENAIVELEARIAENEAKRERMKKINNAYRKGDAAALATLGLDLERLRATVAHVAASAPWVKVPYEGYELTNLGARIRTDKKRIEEVRRRAELAAKADEATGGVLVERFEEHNWCRVTFAEKPERDVIESLKGAGYGWGRGSWNGYLDRLPEGLESGS